MSLDLLTPRQREIAALVAEGLTNREIGARLDVSVSAVSTHLNNALARMDLHSRHELATYFQTDVDWVDIQRRLRRLTPHQRNILIALGSGRTRQQVAQELGVNYANVRRNIGFIYHKLGGPSRGRLMQIARLVRHLALLERTPLSKRELVIVQEIANGYTHAETAGKLRMSRNTLKNHITSILGKLGLADSRQIAIYVDHQGWVDSQEIDVHLDGQIARRLTANGGNQWEW